MHVVADERDLTRDDLKTHDRVLQARFAREERAHGVPAAPVEGRDVALDERALLRPEADASGPDADAGASHGRFQLSARASPRPARASD